jgi:hypothetical protein
MDCKICGQILDEHAIEIIKKDGTHYVCAGMKDELPATSKCYLTWFTEHASFGDRAKVINLSDTATV